MFATPTPETKVLRESGGRLSMVTMTKAKGFTDDEFRVLSSFAAAVEEFTSIRTDMPARHITTYLLVALNEGKTVAEYAERAGVAQSVMTRHLLDLGPMNRRREPGYGLVETHMDPNDLRRHVTYLTAAGRALAHKIMRRIQGVTRDA